MKVNVQDLMPEIALTVLKLCLELLSDAILISFLDCIDTEKVEHGIVLSDSPLETLNYTNRTFNYSFLDRN